MSLLRLVELPAGAINIALLRSQGPRGRRQAAFAFSPIISPKIIVLFYADFNAG